MLTVRKTSGNLADVIAAIPNVPRRVIPYAASTALTRVAKHAATKVLPDAMRKAFDSPTAYTLNSLRVEPSTTATLSARIMVKDMSAGVPQEKYLLPEVDGGSRGRKGMESALRYQGILRGGQFAVPGTGATLDANGNVSGAQVRTILSALKNIRGGVGAKGQRAGRGRKLANDLFAGKPNGGNRAEGIWRREGKRLRMLFVFANKAPSYSPRLDFAGTVQQVARERFGVEFDRAVADMVKKGAQA